MKTTLRSRDLSCPSCVAKIEHALEGLDGVEAARVHFTTGRIEIWHDPERSTVNQLLATVRATGYGASITGW